MRGKLAIVVPYRDREYNLVHFILHMQWFLKPSTFDIFIVEQNDRRLFNRGCLLNIGFETAQKRGPYSHFAFHDVDLLPLRANYRLPRSPTHLSAEVSQFYYKKPYKEIFGGVELFNVSDFVSVNGFSNNYWGWGREDFDLRCRCKTAGLKIAHRDGRYLSLPHSKIANGKKIWADNWKRFHLLQQLDFRKDGLSTLDYQSTGKRIQQYTFRKKIVRFKKPVYWTKAKLKFTDILKT